MRILQIRFKNLNSLVGEWSIDLTHPAYAADGIFAITGPTGAGKSTILDAISLALYGRTPRLNKVTTSTNEIMSRQTGECFAEVTFRTQSGHFRCHWYQHRARKKPGGTLQNARHEVSDADTEKIITNGLHDVPNCVESKTGMDFDRFTRSMLLAQGGFAAFLQAAPDERSPILEQITGTEVYSEISKHVHMLHSEENRKLETLQAELKGMEFLTPEKERELKQDLDQKTQADAKLAGEVEQKGQAVSWLKGKAKLVGELANLSKLKTEQLAKIEEFKPDREKLKAATRALELAADYEKLKAIRDGQTKDQEALARNEAQLPEKIEQYKQAEKAVSKTTTSLVTGKAEQKEASPIIRQTRELDVRVAEKDEPIKKVGDDLAGQREALKTHEGERKKVHKALGDAQADLEKLKKLLASTAADEKLIAEFSGLESRIKSLQELSKQLAGKVNERKQAEGQLEKDTVALRKSEKMLEKQAGELRLLQKTLTGKQEGLKKVLGEQELPEWRRKARTLTPRLETLRRGIEACQSSKECNQAIEQLGKETEVLGKRNNELSKKLEDKKGEQETLEQEVQRLEKETDLLRRIESLKEIRRQLEDGQPCPLCGAANHPYAEGNEPTPDETRALLGKAKSDLKKLSNEILNTSVELTTVQSAVKQAGEKNKEHADAVKKAMGTLSQVCGQLPTESGFVPSDSKIGSKLEQFRDDSQKVLRQTEEAIQTAEALGKEIAKLSEDVGKTKDAFGEKEGDVRGAKHRKETASQTLSRLQKEVADCRARQAKAAAQLGEELRPFGVNEIAVEKLNPVVEQLRYRRKQWQESTAKKNTFEKQISELQQHAKHSDKQIEQAQNEITKKQEHLDRLKQEREELKRQRGELFGEKNPNSEEGRLDAAVKAAGESLETARKASTEANLAMKRTQDRIEELRKAIETRGRDLHSQGNGFEQRRLGAGFEDEKSYLAACLSEEERNRLAEKSQQLQSRLTEIDSQMCAKAQSLKEEQEKGLTDEPQEQLEQALAALREQQKQLQKEIGAIQQQLQDNEEKREQQHERIQAMESQQRECTRWKLLHELIGSADGKKFRNYAQGLTFEIMVGHANRQLRNMSDRYLLIRDAEQPVELNVVDSYQAGEIRSTKNLSGGESFIVSLALALGLSQMASNKVRVDSLFLDEGFGTLDEEALDTALETLASLQQDGKIIGVISHVSALKERIGTQIQVIPQTGGRSLIQGPGCAKA